MDTHCDGNYMMICTARTEYGQQSIPAKGVTHKRPISPIQAPDLSFGDWVPSMDDDDDTASSSSADSKAAQQPQLAEESLMCDEEIGECTQPPAKRQRKSSIGFTCNVSPPGPSRHSWLLDATPQVADVWFQLCMANHAPPNTDRPLQLCMQA
ncbi:hypothetical protein COCOBI_04-2550 [Coccomyxa sp. Obi]|nr:hypothetical protein COCOBI_04-2550 [Coccomyxa sp. Obi]